MAEHLYKPIEVRKYGSSGNEVILVHGGPAAAGSLYPVAKELSDEFAVYEPLQRQSGHESLTVDRHVEDLRAVINLCCDMHKPVIIGHSWGAMLALAFAVKYSDMARCLILVGCGTFDLESRGEFEKIVESRKTDQIKERMAGLGDIADSAKRGLAMGKIFEQMYAYEFIDGLEDVDVVFDPMAHQQTWDDMLKLQGQGVYPAEFANITIPVKMVHGDHDPHPGKMIRDSLTGYIKDLEYIELAKCGHSPWQEKHAKEKFYTVISKLLLEV